MKAAELLRLYKAGRRDFRGESLRGQNFRGKDLSGTDLSGADIRSANFTNATLKRVNFTHAKAGLQRRWVICLVAVSYFLSTLSGSFLGYVGFWVALILDSSGIRNQIAGWSSLIILLVFLVLILRRGLAAGSVAVAIIVAIAVASAYAGAGTFTVAVVCAGAGVGAFTVTVAVAGTLAVAFKFVGVGAVVGTVVGTVAGAKVAADAISVAGANTTAFKFTVAFVFAVAFTLLSAYIGWRSLKEDPRDAWIRSIAIAFAAIGGTSFRVADLTDADFTQARLKSTDFRQSLLIRTGWKEAEQLDRTRPGDTYLNNPKIRQLLITGNGQGQKFDHSLNLRGINLQGAYLVAADFSGSMLKHGTLQGANLADARLKGTNLNNVNLQDVDFSRAKLVQTQLDQADLTGSTLTGACIEDWNITTRTQLNGIRCDYVFMRLPPEGHPDPNPHRKPDDWSKTFADGEFADFIAPMVKTLDLYHNQTVDPRAVAIAFNELREQNPEADLEIVSMEKRGQNSDKLLLRAKSSVQADRSQLHRQYFERYDYLLTLSPQTLVELLMEKEHKAQMLAGMIGTAISKPSTLIDTYNNQGDTAMADNPKVKQEIGTVYGGVAGNVEGDMNIYTPEQQKSLAEAAQEIQQLLDQLSETYSIVEVPAKAEAAIQGNPQLKGKVVGALKGGGKKALQELVKHPAIAILIAAIEGWEKGK